MTFRSVSEVRPAASEAGIALAAVLVAMGILLGLVVPFLLSSGNNEAVAMLRADEARADLASASVRDLLLEQSAAGHVALDPTPDFDDAREFPGQLRLPEVLQPLTDHGRQLLAGEVEDTQRRIDLNTASPLLLANLLRLSAHVAKDTDADADAIPLDDAARLPDQGFVVIDGELIGYGRRSDRELQDLQRAVRAQDGFAPLPRSLTADTLVLDYRVVLAVTWPWFDAFEGKRRDARMPYASVRDLVRLEVAGYGALDEDELSTLERHCTVYAMHELSGVWGHAERVFDIDPESLRHVVQVRSAAFLGGGSVVRIRSLSDPDDPGEHNLVWSLEAPAGGVGGGPVNLPRRWFLNLLLPVSERYAALECVVEPLLPVPVNVNTASAEVLAALLEGLRQGRRVRAGGDSGAPPGAEHGSDQPLSQPGPVVTHGRAQELADRMVTLRDPMVGEDHGPFQGFQDLAQRMFKPLFEESDNRGRQQLIRVYQGLLNGRDGTLDMGTAPICFRSAPLVQYRAAAAATRTAGATLAREERRGVALTVPARALDLVLATQEGFEETFRLDRRAPYYTTHPINVGALLASDRGTDPASRHQAHLLADAFPQLGFGQARFPSRDANGSAFALAPASVRPALRFSAFEDMAQAQDPEGRKIADEGPYEANNSGITSRGGQPRGSGGRHDRISFPLTEEAGVAGVATSFWFRLEGTAAQALYDLAGDDDVRDRVRIVIEDGFLKLEVLDAAGIDPDGKPVPTAPERAAGIWRVPLLGDDGFRIDAQKWYHVSAYARGNRPGQLSLAIDGVPRGEPLYRTYLTQELPAFEPNRGGQPFIDERGRFPTIAVESTEGFPDQGVLRIGLELFEYTSKTAGTFVCEWRDSFGGRLARMVAAEYRPEIPVDENGRPTKSLEDLPVQGDATPAHQPGSAVELYGYSVPLLRDSLWYPGGARLVESVGAFAVARVINEDDPIQLAVPPNRSVPLGEGIAAGTVHDLVLASPLPDDTSHSPPPADERILAGFPQAGGYALLFQDSIGNSDPPIGGVEVIRYAQRSGDRLKGIQRAVQIPTLVPSAGGNNNNARFNFDGQSHSFVCRWLPLPFGSLTVDQYPQYQTYIVPISLPINGQVADPQTTGVTEWVQLYDRSDENKTEWVRYDYTDGQHLVRARMAAFRAITLALWAGDAISVTTDPGPPPRVTLVGTGEPATYDPPPSSLRDIGIGSYDQIEYDFPIVWHVRRNLQFRGDQGTSSHAQAANVAVLPVHRAELDWGNYGGLSGRLGRQDRVAVVEGTAGPGAAFEWNTVNWTARRFGFDPQNIEDPNQERLGPYPFQLVGLKEPVTKILTGPENRDDRVDTRTLDRVVKFPSGELPSAYPEKAVYGGSAHRDLPPANGVIDEVLVASTRVPTLVLDADLAADAGTLLVREDAYVSSFGVVRQAGVLNELPTTGGLLLIDGELIAYRSISGGQLQIAVNGRGMLGSGPERRREGRAHDEGALVYFLDHVPTAILANGVGENAYQLVVDGLGSLPRHGGTLLMGTELLHYTWTAGDALLEMPSYLDPDSDSRRTRGLFRGRYGSAPYSASAGEPVVAFPFRYWDRYRERSGDDPELGYEQITFRTGSAWLSEFAWQEQNEEGDLVDLRCLLRVDGAGAWSDDPDTTPSLLRLSDGQSADGRGLRIGRQGDQLEARFYVVYGQGAFDGVTFVAQAWKYAPRVTGVVLTFDGEPRIVQEWSDTR